MTYQMGSSS